LVKNKFLTIFNEIYKIANVLQSEAVRDVEPSIHTAAVGKSSHIKWQKSTETTVELAHAKWTLAKPMNTKMQMKTNEERKRHHAKCKWKPVRRKGGTTRNETHNAKPW